MALHRPSEFSLICIELPESVGLFDEGLFVSFSIGNHDLIFELKSATIYHVGVILPLESSLPKHRRRVLIESYEILASSQLKSLPSLSQQYFSDLFLSFFFRRFAEKSNLGSCKKQILL